MLAAEAILGGFTLGNLLSLITILLTIVTSVAGAVWYLSRRLSAFEARLTDVEKDRYTVSAACEHALRLAIENPGLRVPDPRKPGEVIQVKGVDGHEAS